MSKILSTIILSLLLITNASADQKVDEALEKCADDRYVNKTNINDFTPMLYRVQSKFQELEKELKSIKLQKEADSKKFFELMDIWEKENPKPKQPTYKQLQNKEYSFEQYKKDNSIWREKNTKFMNKTISSLDDGKKIREKEINRELDKFIRSQALKYVEIVGDLKSKANQINGYLDHFTNCEKQYQDTPSSFLLKWGQ
jgi:hypothetical protein